MPEMKTLTINGVTYDIVDDNTHIGPDAPTDENVRIWIDTDEEGESSEGTKFVTDIMLSANWQENTYSFEETYPNEDYNISVEVSPTATVEQFEAFCAAMICGSADSNVATAIGDVPTVDIPIIIKVVGK